MMRIQRQYKLEKLDEIWCIDWKYGDIHREVHFYLEQYFGMEPDSIEANNLWNLLKTIQKETRDASTHKKAPEISPAQEDNTES